MDIYGGKRGGTVDKYGVKGGRGYPRRKAGKVETSISTEKTENYRKARF